MTQRGWRDGVLLVYNASDVTVDDVIAADDGQHREMMSSNFTQHHRQQSRRISLVHYSLFVLYQT